jgi:hypothetical protein
MVSSCGIDANVKKVQAIKQLQPPQIRKEIRSWQAWWQHSANSYPCWANVVWIPVGWSSGSDFHWAQAIFKVFANPSSTKAWRRVAIICCSYRHHCQYNHRHWTAWSHDESQTIACVFCQRDPEGQSNKVPASLKAALCSPYDDQEAQTLLLDPYCSSRILSAIGASLAKQGSNKANSTMGSGDCPIWCWIHPSIGDQVSSTHGLHCGVDQFRSVRHRWAT